MKFKYRVKGKVNSQLVLRGMLFKVGSKIDFCVSETELDFVKKHCSVDEIIDLEPKVVPIPEPVLENTEKKVVEKPKGVKASGKKQTSGTSQRTNTNSI
ncbi:MAG: hypothetical protein IJ371_01860 [Clostridia bacterium]|nr:hypothetical protein [Clostridia bacterium]